MKNIKYIFIALFISLFACETPDGDVITSDNVLRDIKIYIEGVENAITPEQQGPYENENIEIEIEGDPKAIDLTKVKLVVSVPNNAVVEPVFSGYTTDLSEPFSFKVRGYDGAEKNYTLTAKIIPTVFNLRTLYTKTGSQMGFGPSANRGIALSGDYFIVHSTTGEFKYYNVADASYKGTLSMTGVEWSSLTSPSDPRPFNITSDDAGHIFSANIGLGNGSVVKMYQWDNVTATPKLLLSWTNDQGSSMARKMYVKGDVSKLAYVYLPIAGKAKVVRFEVKNGAVTSNEPDIITLPSSVSWDLNGTIIPVELGKESNYFTVGAYKSPEGWPGFNTFYVNGSDDEVLYKADAFQFLGYGSGLEYLDFQGIKLLFQTDVNEGNWMNYYIKVSKLMKSPESFSTNIQPSIVGHDWGGWISVDSALGNNGNVCSDIKALLSPDGQSATIVSLITNGAVVVRKITLD